MPNRVIRDGILTSERIDQLNWAEEVFYRRLMSVVDDYGRYYAKPELLISACYPLRIRKVSESDVAKFLTACVSAGLVSTYQANDGKRYVEIVDFGQRIQSKSKFPDPPEGSRKSTVENGESPESTEKNGLVVVEDVVVVEGGKGARTRRKKPETFPIPDDFGISDRLRAWAIEKGHTNLEEHLESFRHKAKARGYLYADWDDAFMEAIRKNWAGVESRKSTVSNGESPAAMRKL
jgi:hypothetical protein